MGSLGSLCKGKEQSRGGRPGRAVDRGFRKGLEEEPLQDLESDVVWELLSAASADGEDPESQRRREDVGDTDGLRSNRANGREESTGSSGGSTVPAGIVWVSPEQVGAGCSGAGAADVLGLRLGLRPGHQGLLRQSRSRFDDEGGPETRARAVDGTVHRAVAESAGARRRGTSAGA